LTRSNQENPRLVAVLALALAASIVGCGVLAYLWIDRSISLGYAVSGARSSEQARDLLSTLLEREWQGLAEDEVLTRLTAEAARRPQDQILVKAEPSEHLIWFNNTRFEFQSGKLAKIR